jgi:hypothetical protein
MTGLNAQVTAEFRGQRRWSAATSRAQHLLLLHTVGRRSSLELINRLVYAEDGDSLSRVDLTVARRRNRCGSLMSAR